MVKTILCSLLLFNFQAFGALVTYTVTITNTPLPGAGTNLTVNGITRNWTNAASLTGIQTNSASVSASATNLFRSWASFPQVGVTVYQTDTNVVTFRGLDITVTQGGTWASVSSSSTSTTTTTAFQLPASAAFVSQLWTNIDELSTNRNFGRLTLTAGLGLHGRYLVATNYTLTTNDLYTGVDTRSNTNLILTLPSAATASNLLFLIKDEGGAGATNTIKIYPASGDRIDTLLTNLVISNNFGGAQLRSRGGTNWNVLATGGGVTGGIASSGGGVPLTNSVWVAKNGSDSTGARGDASKAFLTLSAAKTAAVSGDTIFVMPGTYNENDLLKNGVSWHFFNGAAIVNTGAVAIFDDSNITTNNPPIRITGSGVFTNLNAGGYEVLYQGTASDIYFQCLSAYTTNWVAVRANGGGLWIEGGQFSSSHSPAVQVGNGTITINGALIDATHNDSLSGGSGILITGTNVTLRNCTVLGDDGTGGWMAPAPYSLYATTARTVKIDGTFVANNLSHANITYSGITTNPFVTVPGRRLIDSMDFALDTNYTNGNHFAWVGACFSLTATNSADAVVALYLDQDADASFEQTGITAQLGGGSPTNYITTNIVQLGAWVQPGGVFIFTNLSVAPAAAAVNAGSSQWIKQ